VVEKGPKREQLGFNAASCVQLQVQHVNHIVVCNSLMQRTYDERAFSVLTGINQYTEEYRAIAGKQEVWLTSLIESLAELFIYRERAQRTCLCDNPESSAKVLREWLDRLCAGLSLIDSASPQKGCCCKSYNKNWRDVLLAGEVFYALRGAKTQEPAMPGYAISRGIPGMDTWE